MSVMSRKMLLAGAFGDIVSGGSPGSLLGNKLIASDGAASDYFGSSVSISSDGTTALLGAYGDDSLKGSAYVFKYNGTAWIQQAKLTASDGAASNFFGYSVSLSVDGNTAVISSLKEKVYVFKYNGTAWSQQAIITKTASPVGDRFGEYTAISNDSNTILVSAYRDSSIFSEAGAAYIYRYNGTAWIQQAKLTASDRAANDNFSVSVSISSDGTTALIGARLDDDKGTDSGSAYVFKYNGTAWIQQSKLTASDGATSDYFGYSVSISSDGTTALIGAYFDDDKGTDSGSAYVFAV